MLLITRWHSNQNRTVIRYRGMKVSHDTLELPIWFVNPALPVTDWRRFESILDMGLYVEYYNREPPGGGDGDLAELGWLLLDNSGRKILAEIYKGEVLTFTVQLESAAATDSALVDRARRNAPYH